MHFKLPDVIIQERQARNVYTELRDLLSEDDPEQAVAAASSEAAAVARGNKKLIRERGLTVVVDMFEQTLNQAPVFGIFLAAYPHDSFLRELGGWFRREIHAHSLLKIQVRRSIGGGIIVQSTNQMFDMSFRPRILEHKDRVPEITRNV
jgi:hypothetical protein